MSNSKATHSGVMVDALPNIQFKVDVEGEIVLCYLAGKMRKFNINVLIGNKVDIVWSGRKDEIGRIILRK